MAFAAVGSLFSGIAAGTAVAATTVMAAVGTIGSVMGVAGAVTGNKGLMKVGAVMGLVGGVGGLIAGAAGASAGAIAGEVVGESAAGSVFNAAADSQLANVAIDAASGAGTAAAGYGIDAGAAFQASGGGLSELVTDAISSLGEATEPVSNLMDKVVDGGYANEMEASADAFSGGKMPNGPAGVEGPSTKAPAIEKTNANRFAGTSTDPKAVNYVSQTDALSDAASGATPSKDYFKSILDWVNKNKETSKFGFDILKEYAGPNDGKADYYRAAAQESANRYQYGNTVAKPYSYSPQPLIGTR